MRWIDDLSARGHKVDDVGFLIRRYDTSRGGDEVYNLESHPARTNLSREPRLEGWCGTTNNVSVSANGMARVARVARNGRVMVVPITGDEAASALDSLGYPELAR